MLKPNPGTYVVGREESILAELVNFNHGVIAESQHIRDQRGVVCPNQMVMIRERFELQHPFFPEN